MSRSLPSQPSIRFLHEEAKDLLKAQRHGDASACPTLRLLRRFQDAADAEILGEHLALHEAQLALALDYGFASWPDLHREVAKRNAGAGISLDAVRQRCREPIADYAAAGVPLAVVAALNHAGEDIDYFDFAAASGWAFSFGYRYDDVSPAYLAVRGDPAADGPHEVFAFVPTRRGFDYEWAPTAEHEKLWKFVVKHVDAGRPIMSEQMDGGLITAYREHEGKREFFLDGTAGDPAWIDADSMHPYAVYVLVREREPQPWEQIAPEVLRRAVQFGRAHESGDLPCGLAGLRAYLADVSDPGKSFDGHGEWFCWATFSRLAARQCAAAWLRSVAEMLPSAARPSVRKAAAHYEKAFDRYEAYRSEVEAGEPTTRSLQQRARTPQRIAVIAPLLQQGIEAETAGLTALSEAIQNLG